MDMFRRQAPSGGDTLSANDTLIRDGSSETFMTDVIEASMTVPVIVDFWASRRGPDKTVGPNLERLIREAKGAVRLIKIDVDANPQLAAQLRIQSVPTVYAFKDGRPVDGFTGNVPESQLRDFIARLTGGIDPMAAIDEALLEASTLLEQGALENAHQIYMSLFQHDPTSGAAAGGILRCLVLAGQIEDAKRFLESLPAEVAAHADVAAQRSAIELTESAKQLGSTDALAQKLAADPNDHQARYDLALAAFAAGDRETATDQLLELFRRDRSWNEDAARKQLVKLFEAMGHADPLTIASRKRLSSLMFQ